VRSYAAPVQFIALPVAVSLAAKLWPVIVAVIGLIAAVYWARRAVDRHAVRVGGGEAPLGRIGGSGG